MCSACVAYKTGQSHSAVELIPVSDFCKDKHTCSLMLPGSTLTSCDKAVCVLQENTRCCFFSFRKHICPHLSCLCFAARGTIFPKGDLPIEEILSSVGLVMSEMQLWGSRLMCLHH